MYYFDPNGWDSFGFCSLINLFHLLTSFCLIILHKFCIAKWFCQSFVLHNCVWLVVTTISSTFNTGLKCYISTNVECTNYDLCLVLSVTITILYYYFDRNGWDWFGFCSLINLFHPLTSFCLINFYKLLLANGSSKVLKAIFLSIGCGYHFLHF